MKIWSGYSPDPFSQFGIGPDLLAGGPLALIGLAAFISELPHPHRRHASAAGRQLC